jgi:predicted negative regulator of RcsB-dependent stress response
MDKEENTKTIDIANAPIATPVHISSPNRTTVYKAKATKFLKENGKPLVIVLVIVFLMSAYFQQVQRNHQLKSQTTKTTSSTATQAQAISLRNAVSKLMELPSTEVPTIATVTDVAKLKSQAFFANADDGDKVLIFNKAKEVVLFRQSTDKIVEVAPLNQSATGSSSTTAK